MPTLFVNIALAFLEGVGLIISPCILPILPLILSGSLTGSKRRPYGIIVGFMLIFALFTLFSRLLLSQLGVDPAKLRTLAYALLFLFGIVMLSTYLSEKFLSLTQRLLRVGQNWQNVNNSQGGFFSGILFGGLTAIIWTPCAGPILAAVIVQTATQSATWQSFLLLLVFALGAGVPMLAIVLLGRTFMTKVNFFKTHAVACRKVLGAIIIVAVGYLAYGDNLITPSYADTSSMPLSAKQAATGAALRDGLLNPYQAPELVGLTHWLNSSPVTMAELRGKVVLIDFWTYSCINCIRTLPELRDWYQKYHDKGLEIIGVHAPEFEFEKNPANVAAAVKKYAIHYAVALDNQYGTWRAFNNSYWPARYLIGPNGYVVYQHFGEGAADITEDNIRTLLGMSAAATVTSNASFNTAQTPETYLGYARAERFVAGGNRGWSLFSHSGLMQNETKVYSFPEVLAADQWALRGNWTDYADRVVAAAAEAAVRIHFTAGKVYAVLGKQGSAPIQVRVLLGGKRVKEITVTRHDLYTLLSMPAVSSGELELQASAPGLEVYTFTFG